MTKQAPDKPVNMAQWLEASDYFFLTCFSTWTYVTWLRDLCLDFYFTALHSSHTCFCQVMWLFLQFWIIYKSNRAAGRMVGVRGSAVWMVASGGRPCVPCSSYAYKDLSVKRCGVMPLGQTGVSGQQSSTDGSTCCCVFCQTWGRMSRDINIKVGILWDGALRCLLQQRLLLLPPEARLS